MYLFLLEYIRAGTLGLDLVDLIDWKTKSCRINETTHHRAEKWRNVQNIRFPMVLMAWLLRIISPVFSLIAITSTVHNIGILDRTIVFRLSVP